MNAYYNENDPKAASWLRQLIKNGDIAHGEVDERSITEVQPSDLNGFTQVHLFAGIGGWSLALRIAGIPDDYPVWTGSCPCPPFSVAGKKKACPGCQSASLLPHPYRTGIFACCDCGHQWFAAERHLWPEFHRLIKECRPAIVFGADNHIDWRTADRIYCRDDKWRPVEPGTFPLVDGLPKGLGYSSDPSAPIDAEQTAEAHVMCLRGYGNAIHPYLAAEFISLSFESMAAI